MLEAGFDVDEPYLNSLLRRHQKLRYDSLRAKLDFTVQVSPFGLYICLTQDSPVLLQDSCYLFGVVDEIGILKDEEVYINIPSRRGVMTGFVLVAR